MADSTIFLAKKLTDLIDSGQINKAELSRKSGLDRSGIDKFLKGNTIPRLDFLDKISEALGIPAHELIKNDKTPLVLSHSLQDCLESLHLALIGRQRKFPNLAKAIEERGPLEINPEKPTEPSLLSQLTADLLRMDETKRNKMIKSFKSQIDAVLELESKNSESGSNTG